MYTTTADDRLNRAARSFACADRGALDEALDRLSDSLKQHGEDARVRRVAGCFFMDRLGRGCDARAEFQKALELDGSDVVSLARSIPLAPSAARCEVLTARLRSARVVHVGHTVEKERGLNCATLLSETLEENGDWVQAQLSLADYALVHGEHGFAAALLEVALVADEWAADERAAEATDLQRRRAFCLAQLDAEQLAAWHEYGRPTSGAGRPMLDDALWCAEAVLSHHPTDVDRFSYLTLRVRVGATRADLHTADELVARLTTPGAERAEALLCKATIHAHLGEPQEATRALAKLDTIDPALPGLPAILARTAEVKQRLETTDPVDLMARLKRLRDQRRKATRSEPRTGPGAVESVARGAGRRYPLARYRKPRQFVAPIKELLEDFSPEFCLGVLYAMRHFDARSATGLLAAARVLVDHSRATVSQAAARLLVLHIVDEGDEAELERRFFDVLGDMTLGGEQRIVAQLRALDDPIADWLTSRRPSRSPSVAPDRTGDSTATRIRRTSALVLGGLGLIGWLLVEWL